MRKKISISAFLEIHPEERKFIPRIVISLAQFVVKMFIKFFQDNCITRAAGLAFSTILALVPLTAVFFGFGGELANVQETAQDFLARTLLPTSQEIILDALNKFTENSRKLGTWGLLLFLITAVFLLNNIENQFNQIFRSRPSKNMFFRLAIYTSSLVLGSLLIGASFSLTNSFLSQFTHVTKKVFPRPFPVEIGFSMLSVFFMVLVLLLLIYLLPTARIKFSSAMIGASIGAVIWELAKWAFRLWVNMSVRYSVIFGSLFLIPITLLWLYIGWMIILISLEATFIHQHKTLPLSITGNLSVEQPYGWISSGLTVYLYICEQYRKKERPPGLVQLSKKFGLPERTIAQMTNIMEQGELLFTVDKRRKGFVPAAALDKITLEEILTVLTGYKSNLIKIETFNTTYHFFNKFTSDIRKNLKGETVENILKKYPPKISETDSQEEG